MKRGMHCVCLLGLLIALSACVSAGKTPAIPPDELAATDPDVLAAHMKIVRQQSRYAVGALGPYDGDPERYVDAARRAYFDQTVDPPSWPMAAHDLLDAVRDGEVEEGMPPELVYLAWGPPTETSRERSTYGDVERWHWRLTLPVERQGRTTRYIRQQYRTATFLGGALVWWSIEDP